MARSAAWAASLYPHYVAKAEVDAILSWLTGYGPDALARGKKMEKILGEGR